MGERLIIVRPCRPGLAGERAGAGLVIKAMGLALLASTIGGTMEARAQEAGDEIRQDALHVFLDCQTFPCSSDYFRTEVAFVNWVRDRTLAQVPLSKPVRPIGSMFRWCENVLPMSSAPPKP